MPAPVGSVLPLAVLLVLIEAPFLAAIYFSSMIGRPSPTLPELIGEALVVGATIGFLLDVAFARLAVVRRR